MVKKIDIEKENREILNKYRTLLRACKNKTNAKDKKDIRKAFNLAMDAHKGVRRKSGEPYIYHPLAVAHISAKEIDLGATSIVCALLHDVVEAHVLLSQQVAGRDTAVVEGDLCGVGALVSHLVQQAAH